MRKKFATFLANPRRLLSLLLIQTFVALAVPFADGSSTQIIDISKFGNISGGTPLIKAYLLKSGCSDKFIQMDFKRIINARAKETTFASLNFISSGSGRIRIKGDAVKKFLCFSRNGRLINRTNGGSARCQFHEEPHENYIKLRSAANKHWYVGFKKNGRKLKGYAPQTPWKKEKCFMFIKMEFKNATDTRNRDKELANAVDNFQKTHRLQDKYRGHR